MGILRVGRLWSLSGGAATHGRHDAEVRVMVGEREYPLSSRLDYDGGRNRYYLYARERPTVCVRCGWEGDHVLRSVLDASRQVAGAYLTCPRCALYPMPR